MPESSLILLSLIYQPTNLHFQLRTARFIPKFAYLSS
jgi:hypothetical protein